MMDGPNTIFDNTTRGIYLVIDPRMDRDTVLIKLTIALSCNIIAVQIWDNSIEDCDYVQDVLRLCKQYNTPLFINNKWEWMDRLDFDGIHLDGIPVDWERIKYKLNNKLLGITCTNDLQIIEWAESQNFDYISFCSMFISKNSARCDLVDFDTIHKARQMTDIPFVLAGGITLDNIELLASLDYQGVAMISGLNEEETLEKKINDIYAKLNNG